jgi:hypothetical protein
MTFLILQKFCEDVSDVNTEALKNVRFRLQIVFCRRLDIVAALYNPFQTCLQPCYEYGGRNVSSKQNNFK